MKILACHVDNFGKLSDFSIDFSKDIQVINEHNAWGKSTLAGFLKVMFYGLDAKKEPGAVDKERNLYAPWQGGTFGGELDFEIQGKQYRISRTFGKSEKTDVFHLYDLKTNLESFDYSRKIGEELFGLDSASFKRSIYIVQNHIASNATDDINAKLGNITETTNDINNFEKAYLFLKNEMNALSPNRATGSIKRRKGRIEELNQEIRGFEATEEAIDQIRRYRKQEMLRRDQMLEGRRQNALVLQRTSANQILLEKKKQYEQLCREEKERLESCKEYDDFFPEGVPSEEHLTKMSDLIQLIKEQQILIENRKKEEPSEELYATYAKMFSDGIPSAQKIQEQIDKQNSIIVEEEERQKLERRENEILLKAQQEQFQRKIERQKELQEEREKEKRLREEAKKSLEQSVQKNQQISMLGALAAGIGIVLTNLVFFLLDSTLWILAVVFSVIAIAGVIVGVLSLQKAKQMKKKIPALEAAQQEVWEEQEEEKDYEYREEEFVKDDSLTQIRTKVKRQKKEIKRRQEQVLDFLQPYFGDVEPEKALASLYDLTQKAQEYARWESTRQLRQTAEEEEENLKKLFARFLEEYRLTILGEPAVAIRQIETKAAEYRERLKSYADVKEKKAAFEVNNDMEALSGEIKVSVSVEELQSQMDVLDEQLEEQQKIISSYDRQLENLQEKMEARAEKEQELSECYQKQEEELHQFEIMELTQTYLKQAKEQFVARYMTPVSEAFREYYEYLYPNAPKDWMIDANIEFRTKEHGELRDTDRLSQGYQDLVGVCMRLALVDAMYQEEKPFLILDDPFVNLDEEKVEQAKKLLKKVSDRYQIIYFTCHDSRTPFAIPVSNFVDRKTLKE